MSVGCSMACFTTELSRLPLTVPLLHSFCRSINYLSRSLARVLSLLLLCLITFCLCSHLLEEEQEPFEVLPKGNIGPSLLMALRVLFAPENTFLQWKGLEGVLSYFA